MAEENKNKPRDRDVTVQSAYADEGMGRPCMLATCWAQEASGCPTVPARVMNKETRAMLDTGSVVTLLRPDLAEGREGSPMEVTCVHRDTRTYGTCHVVIRTPQGVFTARAGIVPHLPVPLLIGRDCPIAHQKQIVPHREAHQKQIMPHREAHQKQIMPHREAHQKQIVPHREAHKKQISSLWDEKLKAVDKERNRELQDLTGKQDRREQTNADALSRRDTCLGGFPYYRGA
ncbi:uncharacterized protein LOC115534869 [Gadus morhua]|uniref:uncharacterized protein LOC115534869 n=1 Tax=Gadus morhua TaxID=8049 RepID=UPI0011B46472|nr:uncharacterized protein LOC115534869 [Gadus morhua]